MTNFSLLPKKIWKEEFHYYSDQPVDILKNDIQKLFEQTKGWDFSVNLAGKFISEHEFKITPKWQFVVIKNFEREASFLNGKIFQDELKRTRVTFNVRPNSIVAIFFFIFPIVGISLIINTINVGINTALIVGLFFTIAVPILMLLFAHIAKKEIKNRFIETFYLKEV